MEHDAIAVLDRYRVMTVATLRPDGWPQATMVGYANQGLRLFFVVSRRSQKLSNVSRDERVSIAIAEISVFIPIESARAKFAEHEFGLP